MTGPVARLPEWARPLPLEVACGLALGADPGPSSLPRLAGAAARSEFEAAVRRALARPPCLVSFSGGRDSSVVLAVAAAVARAEGLPLPVPATYRFADAPGSREDEWQERVVRHLRLPDWERPALSAELDSVGPVARPVLRRHGLVWPFNAHFHMPLLERATGGSLLTGIGGDELLGPQQWARAQALLAGRRRWDARAVLTVGAALAPVALRRYRLARRRNRLRFPWLVPAVEEEVNRRITGLQADAPRLWSRCVAWWWRGRSRTVLTATMAALAADADTQIVHPFLDPRVVGSVAARFGGRGPAHRTAALVDLFGDVLPEPVLGRRHKAHFDEAFFSEHSRAFVHSWTGDGVDPAIVDAERLADIWRSPDPDPRSFLLLQAVWLAGIPFANT